MQGANYDIAYFLICERILIGVFKLEKYYSPQFLEELRSKIEYPHIFFYLHAVLVTQLILG